MNRRDPPPYAGLPDNRNPVATDGRPGQSVNQSSDAIDAEKGEGTRNGSDVDLVDRATACPQPAAPRGAPAPGPGVPADRCSPLAIDGVQFLFDGIGPR